MRSHLRCCTLEARELGSEAACSGFIECPILIIVTLPFEIHSHMCVVCVLVVCIFIIVILLVHASLSSGCCLFQLGSALTGSSIEVALADLSTPDVVLRGASQSDGRCFLLGPTHVVVPEASLLLAVHASAHEC